MVADRARPAAVLVDRDRDRLALQDQHGARSPPARPTVAITAARMTAGSALATTAPTTTATAKMNTARAGDQHAAEPEQVNEFDMSGSWRGG